MSNDTSDLYVGNLDSQVTEDILCELMSQFAPVKSVRIPKDKVSLEPQGFGFVDFYSAKDCMYIMRLIDGLRLFGRPLRLRKAVRSNTGNGDDHGSKEDIGPIVFVGNLDILIDSKTLVKTFSNFGPMKRLPEIIKPEEEDGKSKACYAFIYFTKFESGDRAIKEMDGKMVMNRPVKVDYAFKRGSKTEKHGDKVERLLYKKAEENNYTQVNPESQRRLKDVLSGKKQPGKNYYDHKTRYDERYQ